MIAPVEPNPSLASVGKGRHRAGNIRAALVMLTWVGAFTPDPLVLCTVPGIVGWMLLVERCRSTRQAMLWTFLFGAIAIGYGYRWLAQTTPSTARCSRAGDGRTR